MAGRSYSVKAVWDPEAEVWISQSDIIDLHIEASTVDEFEALMMELAPELIGANHASKAWPFAARFAAVGMQD